MNFVYNCIYNCVPEQVRSNLTGFTSLYKFTIEIDRERANKKVQHLYTKMQSKGTN